MSRQTYERKAAETTDCAEAPTVELPVFQITVTNVRGRHGGEPGIFQEGDTVVLSQEGIRITRAGRGESDRVIFLKPIDNSPGLRRVAGLADSNDHEFIGKVELNSEVDETVAAEPLQYFVRIRKFGYCPAHDDHHDDDASGPGAGHLSPPVSNPFVCFVGEVKRVHDDGSEHNDQWHGQGN